MFIHWEGKLGIPLYEMEAIGADFLDIQIPRTTP